MDNIGGLITSCTTDDYDDHENAAFLGSQPIWLYKDTSKGETCLILALKEEIG